MIIPYHRWAHRGTRPDLIGRLSLALAGVSVARWLSAGHQLVFPGTEAHGRGVGQGVGAVDVRVDGHELVGAGLDALGQGARVEGRGLVDQVQGGLVDGHRVV